MRGPWGALRAARPRRLGCRRASWQGAAAPVSRRVGRGLQGLQPGWREVRPSAEAAPSERGLPRVFRQGGGLRRRLVVPGASGVLQRPHRSDGVMRAVDCCIVRALGTQQTYLLLHLRVLALLFISCDLEELVSYK